MTTVDYQKLKKLRGETGVSFSLCKKALEETGNDLAKAKKKLSEWGAEKASEKEERATKQGAVFSYVHHNGKIASLAEILCETDFVSGNAEFRKLGNELAMQVASSDPRDAKALLKQEYIREPGKTIAELIKEAVLKFGENIRVGRISRLSLDDK